jgi:cytochrome P450
MGCDIHFCIEKRVTRWDDTAGDQVPVEPARWVGVYGTWETPMLLTDRDPLPLHAKERDAWYVRRPRMKIRNYEFFAKLAGVRGEGPTPKGFPEDASELAQMMVSGDDHSYSYDTLEDFIRTYLLTAGDETIAATVVDQLKGGDGLVAHTAGVFSSDLHLYRVVYWFDN